MNSARLFSIVVVLVLSSQLASAQDLSRYRSYALDSSLDAILAASGAGAYAGSSSPSATTPCIRQ